MLKNIIAIVAIALFGSCTGLSQANPIIPYPSGGGTTTLPTAGAAGQQLTATGAGNTYAAQSKIALDPRDFGADFNGASVADATTTSGSNVITCANSDCNFPSNISGYIIFATAGTGSSCLDNASITFGGALQTTVTGFTNANSITVSGTSNTTATATACLAWFPKDSTTALNAWWTAGGCTGVYQMPAGKTLFSSAIMQNLSGCNGAINQGYAYPGQTVKGAGLGSTFLMPAPVFNYTITGAFTTNCVVGNLNVEDEENFAVWGLGERATASMNTCLFMVGQASRSVNNDLVGWNARGGSAQLVGVYMLGATDVFEVGGSNYFGSIEMFHAGTQQFIFNNYISGNNSTLLTTCGMVVASTASVTSVANNFAICTQVNAGGSLNSTGSQYFAADSAAIFANGGVLNFLGADQINPGAAATTGINFSATGSKVTVANSTLKGVVGSSGNTLLDQGGNTFSGTITLSGLLWPSSTSVVGVAAASSNIALGAGFGTSPSSSSFSANADFRHFTFTITVGTGAQTQATSTVTYTFPSSFNPFVTAPGSCKAQQVGGNNPPLTFQTTTLPSTTSVVFTPTAVATASDTIILAVDCQ